MIGRIRTAMVGLLTVCAVTLGCSSMLGDRAMAAPAPAHRLGGTVSSVVCDLRGPDHRLGPAPAAKGWG